MSKVVKVTRAQVIAARALVRRFEQGIDEGDPCPAVRAIGQAERRQADPDDTVCEQIG